MKIIINADDFGANDGINAAVEQAFKKGCLNSASLMVYGSAALAAADIAKKNPKLSVGLHADFDKGFVAMMFQWLFARKKFKAWLEKELRKQIDACAKLGIKKLSHLDSHRHVHMIPAAFSVFKKVAAAYKIPRVRVVNENFFRSFWGALSFSCVWNLAWVKWPVLTVFRWMSGRAAATDVYFYGLVYSGELFGRATQKISVPKRFNTVEIGIHPMAFTDKSGGAHATDAQFYSSPNRIREFETVMDKNFLRRVTH